MALRYKYLNDNIAKKMYKNIKNKLDINLTEVDEPLLIALCNQYTRYIKLEDDVLEQGEVIYTSNGNPYLNPSFNAMQASIKTLSTLSKEFGLTIASRRKNDIKFNDKKNSIMHDILEQC